MQANRVSIGTPVKVWSLDSSEYYGSGIIAGHFYVWRSSPRLGRTPVLDTYIAITEGPNAGTDLIAGLECFYHTIPLCGLTERQAKAMEQITPFKRNGQLAIGTVLTSLSQQLLPESFKALKSLLTTQANKEIDIFEVQYDFPGRVYLALNITDVTCNNIREIIKHHFSYDDGGVLNWKMVAWIHEKREIT